MNTRKLWLVRVNPEGNNRLKEFLQESIVAIGWPNIPDMTNLTKGDIRIALIQGTSYTGKDANLKVGLINHFVNNMNKGDWCLVPDSENIENIYIAEIVGDYHYEKENKKDGYPHQRKIKWLNNREPLNRYELPEEIQTSLRTQLTVADLSNHVELLVDYIEGNHFIYGYDLEKEFQALVPKSLQILKNALESDDPKRRLEASIAVLNLVKSQTDKE